MIGDALGSFETRGSDFGRELRQRSSVRTRIRTNGGTQPLGRRVQHGNVDGGF